MPNRFENYSPVRDGACGTLYIDYALSDLPKDHLRYRFNHGLREVEIAVTTHPHAGCFFLNREQLAQLEGKKNFGIPHQKWVTWLDTAATHALATSFTVLKSSAVSIDWFQIRHGSKALDGCLFAPQDSLPVVRFGHPALALGH